MLVGDKVTWRLPDEKASNKNGLRLFHNTMENEIKIITNTDVNRYRSSNVCLY